MQTIRIAGAVLAAGAMLAVPLTRGAAQRPGPRAMVELRGGLNVPTFDIADAAKAGGSVGAGAAYKLSHRFWLTAAVDVGFHEGANLPGGAQGPGVNVYHYIMGLAWDSYRPDNSPWSVMLNVGAGAMTFDLDGGTTKTYPAINVGAKIGYDVSPAITVFLSPQGDIAFTDRDVLGTDDAWVWPFSAGVRITW
jgi:hypothetical protein